MDGTGHHWMEVIVSFSYKIHYPSTDFVCQIIKNRLGRPFNNADRWGGADQGNDRPNHNFRQNTLAQNDLGGPIQNIGNNAGFGGSGNVPRVGMGVLVNENLTENTSRAKVGGIAMPSTLPENRTAQSIRAKYPDANDCEIIVVAKNLT